MNEIPEFGLKGYCGLTPEPDIRRVKGDEKDPTQAGVRTFRKGRRNKSFMFALSCLPKGDDTTVCVRRCKNTESKLSYPLHNFL